jgi:hypothetical protein
MTSIFLSLTGFYLVTGAIKADSDSGVGQIISATKIGNFSYLLAKVLSNFIVLFTILFVVFMTSIALLFLYGEGYALEVGQFIRPYLFITLPSLFIVSVVAVLLEVIFKHRTTLQNITFFFLFVAACSAAPRNAKHLYLDVFNGHIVINQMIEDAPKMEGLPEDIGLNIGYTISENRTTQNFEFEGAAFTNTFILSRLVWALLGLGAVGVFSIGFHRFKVSIQVKKKKSEMSDATLRPLTKISLSELPKPIVNYGIAPILKTELLLLFRNGSKWLWLLNLIGMACLIVLPINIAHQIVLPILWFLQVGRISQLGCKEEAHKVHYFTWFGYNAMYRVFLTQISAAIILCLGLALPLVARYALQTDFTAVATVCLGVFVIVSFATLFSTLTKSKKLFEVLFFMVTYINLNGLSLFDYFGASQHPNSYWLVLGFIVMGMLGMSFFKRYREVNG